MTTSVLLTAALLAAVAMPRLAAQTSGVLTVVPPAKLVAKKNTTVTARVGVQLRNGYHVNSNTPADPYLIPLRLSWVADPLEPRGVSYPSPKMEKYDFSEKPLSVFTGDFELATKFNVPAKANAGLTVISGKLRYQACNHKECLPPKTIEIKLPVDIVN